MDFQNYIDSKLIVSIPIYFRSPEKHEEYFKQKEQEYINSKLKQHKKLRLNINKNDKIQWKVYFNKRYYYQWEYNEVIGYIEIRKKLHNLFAFLFLVSAKRFEPIMTRKIFKISNDFPDYCIDMSNLSNKEIITEIYKILKKINDYSRRFKKYYIDTCQIDSIIGFIDFHSV